MSFFFQQIFLILTTSPGNLTYYIVLAFAIAGSWQASVSQWRRSGFPQGRRMVLGLAALLLVLFAQFAVTGLAWPGLLSSRLILPPVDRLVTLLGLVIILWLWLFPEPKRLADAATIMLGMLVITFFALTMVWWRSQSSEVSFNGSLPDTAASLLAMALCALGALILLIRRPNAWGVGLAMSIILFAGHLAHWYFGQPGGDFPGAVRLAQLAAYPLLFALPQRFPIPESTRPAVEPLVPERRRYGYGTDPSFIQEFIGLATETSSEKLCQNITRVVSQMVLADYCLFISLDGRQGTMSVPCGYNLIQEAWVKQFPLDSQEMPVVTNALRRGRFLRLPASSTSPDLLVLAQALHLVRVGHLLFVPISLAGDALAQGIILISPFSNRGWTQEDQTLLSKSAEYLRQVLKEKQVARDEQENAAQARDSLRRMREYADQIQAENQELLAQLEKARSKMEEERTRAESLADLISRRDSDDAARQKEPAVGNLADDTMVSLQEYQFLEAQLQMALEDVATIKDALYKADQKALELQTQVNYLEAQPAPIQLESAPSAAASSGQAEVVVSIAQELRQPLSSIVGYTDLLLGESVGILGALQRKFLERIKASVERMGGLADDLIQLTLLEDGQVNLKTETVDLNRIIDDAVANSMTRLREKNIILRMDLPDELPALNADRDALQQILLHLLHNAGEATPIEGEISLRASVEARENESGYVLLQVVDSGPGISTDDLPRVFSRLYRTDNPTIGGVGDTGVGLTIVKALVEAHGGRIWVDSTIGQGSTYSVLLPVAIEEIGWLVER